MRAPAADAFVKALNVIFLVGRMDLVIILAESDQHMHSISVTFLKWPATGIDPPQPT